MDKNNTVHKVIQKGSLLQLITATNKLIKKIIL